MELVVRPVTLEDGDVARALRLRSLRENPEAFASTHERESAFSADRWAERLRSNAEGDRSICFVAELDGAPVGIVVGLRDEPPTGSAYLNAMWVAPEARRRGVGRALVEAVCAWAARRFERVLLGVTSGNREAEATYAACGFVRSDEVLDEAHGGSACEITMVRVL